MTPPHSSPFDYTQRAAGILLHPTSFPSSHGIGDLGADAKLFIDFLHDAGMQYWQIMPLSPTGYGDSPYAGFSAFAGNHYLISLDALAEDELMPSFTCDPPPSFPDNTVDYGPVITYKMSALACAFSAWHAANGQSHALFSEFCAKNDYWLPTYCAFMAGKECHDGAVWNTWKTTHISEADTEEKTLFHAFLQFFFERQWQDLRSYAHDKNIAIIGDVPIFVAYDSADVWAHPSLFLLDNNGAMTAVAGVPPDFFSETGQRWGNPLYNWENRDDVFAWWTQRFQRMTNLVDVIRLDHFRGFDACWHVPAQDETAENGAWIPVPGRELFAHLSRACGALPIIAEDLGVITQEVDDLRRACGFPGMYILQFGFGGKADSIYLPHNYTVDRVVYTGSHDNDTTRGWYQNAPPAVTDHVRHYLAVDGSDIAWDMIRASMQSVAFMAIIPFQDVLNLGSDARMNFPGRPQGNWQWRYTRDMCAVADAVRLKHYVQLYGRQRTLP